MTDTTYHKRGRYDGLLVILNQSWYDKGAKEFEIIMPGYVDRCLNENPDRAMSQYVGIQ